MQDDNSLPFKLARELYDWASERKNNVEEYKYFVREIDKIPPKERHKFFYNLAQWIHVIQATP